MNWKYLLGKMFRCISRKMAGQAIKSFLTKITASISLLIAIFFLNACASNSRLNRNIDNTTLYTFTFDTHETPDVEILDFRYGDGSKSRTIKNPEYLISKNQSLQGISIYAKMPKTVKLYVKWRIKSTNDVHEHTEDLTQKLLGNFKINYLTFMIEDKQLYIYLVTTEPRPKNFPAKGPKVYQSFKTLTIYPN